MIYDALVCTNEYETLIRPDMLLVYSVKAIRFDRVQTSEKRWLTECSDNKSYIITTQQNNEHD